MLLAARLPSGMPLLYLRQWGETDDAAAVVGGYLEVVVLRFWVEHGTAVLREQARYMRLLQYVVASLLQFWRILRDAHIERLSLSHQVDECLHGLFDGCHTVVAMAVEDVEVFQSCAFQALVAAGNQVLAAAARAIHPRPHVVSCL